MTTSRRRFLTLVTAGSAALLAGAAPVRAQTKTRPRATGKTANRPRAAGKGAAVRPRAVEAEIASQKAYVTRALRAVRGYALPAGSEMGFAFRPLAPRKRKGQAR